jgi:hypothetical protein
MLKSKKYNKTVILLGELHTTGKRYLCNDKSKFIPIADYLETLFKKTKEHIDFFIEMPYQKKIKEPYMDLYQDYSKTGLTLIGKKFESCLSYKKKCSYKNVYMHYTEVDQTDKELRHMTYAILQDDYDEVIPYFIKLIKKHKTLDKYTKYLLTVLKIQKQLDNIPSDIHKKLLSSLHDYIKTNRYALEHQTVKNITEKEHAFIIFKYIRFMTDLYLLARMFRKFPGITRMLLYAGQGHIQN